MRLKAAKLDSTLQILNANHQGSWQEGHGAACCMWILRICTGRAHLSQQRLLLRTYYERRQSNRLAWWAERLPIVRVGRK